jgi:hypothetical protein
MTMIRLPGCLAGAVLILTLLAVQTPPAQAQIIGYRGIAYPGYGFDYGYPGYGNFGFGYPGFGYGYFGGFPAYGYGYGFGFDYPGYASMPFGPFGPGYSNPLFGLGLTPLGVQSALGERYILGRGLPAAGQVTVRPATPSTSPGTYSP